MLAKTSTIASASMFTSTVAKLQLKGHLKGPKALLKNWWLCQFSQEKKWHNFMGLHTTLFD